MEYIIIIPAHNEEDFIAKTIDSILEQTLLPKQLIVVNDCSDDQTPQIVAEYAKKHKWIWLIHNDKKEKRASGAKVVRVFYKGYKNIREDYDFLVKLDADLELPPNYFEEIAKMFKNDPLLGICGGTIITEKDGNWVYENFSDEDHVKGAYKSYRKNCFKEIGGLRPSIGWDTADELLAKYHGWHTKTNTDLKVKHFRPLGTETGSIRIRVKVGQGMYRLRYGFFLSLISAAKAGYLNKPYFLTGIAVMAGWLKSFFRREPFMVTKKEGKFIRNLRKERMSNKFKHFLGMANFL